MDYFLGNAKTKIAVGFECKHEDLEIMESQSRIGFSGLERTATGSAPVELGFQREKGICESLKLRH